jgi:hypothetical protein
MADVLPDIVKTITRDELGGDKYLVLTAYFNGGPITVLVDDHEGTKGQVFSGHPAFADVQGKNYISNGILSFNLPEQGDEGHPTIITVSFANLFSSPPTEVQYKLQLTSLPNKPANAGSQLVGKIEKNQVQNIIFYIEN